MKLQEWQTLSRSLYARADALTSQIVSRARNVAYQAGLDPSCPFLHAHNALVSREYGKPWPEVDYDKARLVLHLEQKSFEPHRIADRVSARAFQTVIR